MSSPRSSSSYQQLQPEERITIASLIQQRYTVRGIARLLGRSASTISREVERNAGCKEIYGSQHAFAGILPFLGGLHWFGLAVHQQPDTGHPQLRQGKRGMQLLSVLAQASVANLDAAELALDDPEGVLDFGPNLGFGLLESLLQGGIGSIDVTPYWGDLEEAREFATQWKWRYNHERPNMALGGITPKQRLAMAA